MTLIFWLSLTALAFTYVGYPLWLFVILKLLPKRSVAVQHDDTDGDADRIGDHIGELAEDGNAGNSAAKVSVVLVARDEEQRIGDRLTNLLASKDVAEMEIVLVCDGCSDATAQRAQAAAGAKLHLVEFHESRGKAHGINAGVAAATGEIVVFADARQRFDDSAVAKLVAAFDDCRVAAVSGSLEIEASQAGTGAGVDLYWKLEKFIRQSEARIDSCIGCTGAIYAIRRKLFEPMPDDTILDDVVVPMRLAVAGGQVKFLADALAYDPQKLAPDTERRRKTRTLAGNFQMLVRYPGWLLPWRNRLWWQLIAHKYLRLAGPVLLVVCLVSNLMLISWHPLFILTMVGQLAFYLFAVIGLLVPSSGWRLLTVTSGFVFLQWLCVRGFFEWLRRSMSRADGTWK